MVLVPCSPARNVQPPPVICISRVRSPPEASGSQPGCASHVQMPSSRIRCWWPATACTVQLRSLLERLLNDTHPLAGSPLGVVKIHSPPGSGSCDVDDEVVVRLAELAEDTAPPGVVGDEL